MSRCSPGDPAEGQLQVGGTHAADGPEHEGDARAPTATREDHPVIHGRDVEVVDRALVADGQLACIDGTEDAQAIAISRDRVTGADLEAGIAREIDARRQDLTGRRVAAVVAAT